MSASPACPFCDASGAERVGQWGGQIITSQWRCRACGSYFEALREAFDDPGPPIALAAGAAEGDELAG